MVYKNSLDAKKVWSGLLRLVIIGLLLGLNLLAQVSPKVQAADPPPGGPPPGGPGGGNSPQPSANLIFRDMDKIFNPKTGVPGELLTYTLRVVCDPYKDRTLSGRYAEIELTLFNSQKFVKFDPLKTNWTLRNVSGKTLYIDMGTLKPGDDGTIQIVTIAPDDLNKPIMEQGIYLNWQDDGSTHHRGFTLLLPLKVSTTTPPPTVPNPSGETLSNLPKSGPFAAQVAPPANQENSVTKWYIAATSHNLAGEFLNYWLEHGAVTVLGYPISEVFREEKSGLILQYFERGVMEYHPENNPPYQVLIKSLGRELGKATPEVPPNSEAVPGSVYYPDTGHWLDGRFVNYWKKNGGLEQFGFPIGEPSLENGRVVQWTERARFEVQANSQFTPLVELGLVGVEFAKFQGFLPK